MIRLMNFWLNQVSKYWYLLIIVLGMFIVSVVIIESPSNHIKGRKSIIQSYKTQEYHGKVISKKIDKIDHMSKKVFIKLGDDWSTQNAGTKERIVYFNGWSNSDGVIFEYIMVGDSLVKKSGELNIKIEREGVDTIFFYEFSNY